jgi:cell division protein YceG involved in septum cleavage
MCAEFTDPGQCRYLYYVLADEDGRHIFAATLEQHLANVQKSIEAGVL